VSEVSLHSPATCVLRVAKKLPCRSGKSVLVWYLAADPWRDCRRALLEFGNTPQKEIAQSLRYKDVASFARVFRKATGLAPGAYRNRFGLNAVSPDDYGRKSASSPKLRIFEAGIQPG
jgi:hypothetical protein